MEEDTKEHNKLTLVCLLAILAIVFFSMSIIIYVNTPTVDVNRTQTIKSLKRSCILWLDHHDMHSLWKYDVVNNTLSSLDGTIIYRKVVILISPELNHGCNCMIQVGHSRLKSVNENESLNLNTLHTLNLRCIKLHNTLFKSNDKHGQDSNQSDSVCYHG